MDDDNINLDILKINPQNIGIIDKLQQEVNVSEINNNKCNFKNIDEHKEFILDKLDEPWNYRIMLQLKKIGEKSMGYKWMHNEDMMYYTLKFRCLTLIEVILLSLIGTLSGIEIFSLFTTNNKLISILSTCIHTLLVIIYGLIKAIKESSDYPSRIYNHRWSSVKFGQISSEIQNQFCLPINKRDSDTGFLQYKTTDYNDNLLSAPVIRSCTRNKYINGTKNINISQPLSLGSMEKIEIVIDKGENNDIDIKDIKLKDHANHIKQSIENKFEYEMERFLRFN